MTHDTPQPTAPLAELQAIDIIAIEARQAAASLGIACAHDLTQSLVQRIIKRLGGQKIYIPSNAAQEARQRARAIRTSFNGANIDQLARRHGISPRQVRNILKSDGAA